MAFGSCQGYICAGRFEQFVVGQKIDPNGAPNEQKIVILSKNVL